MTYRVYFTETFVADVENHVRYLLGEHVSRDVVEAWYDRLFKQIDALREWPRLYPVDEYYSGDVGRPTHKLNFGNYLVFYQLDDDRRQVNVVAFIHGARRR